MADGPLLAQLHFGREDAERDVQDGLLLRGGFLPNAAYRGALSGRKMLIIGRKGSGKSAICMQLKADGVGHYAATELIPPDETAGEEIRRFELQGLPGDSAKALIWRYLFAVYAARHLVAHAKDAHGRRPDSVKALARFLKQNGESADGRFGDRLAQAARGLQTSLSLEAFGFKAGLDLAQAPVSEGAQATRQLDVVEQGVAQAFRDLGCGTPGAGGAAHGPLLLMVDQLELVWSAEADSNSMVIGLLLAAKHASSLYGCAVRVLLFLRADIYDSLHFGEGDKFRGDELRITWTEQALRDLALARARASAGAELTPETLWGDLFPAAVEGEETATYLFRRCLPRPRDAIQFLNLCQETASLIHGRDRITEGDVVQAGRQFSDWKLKDLALEYLVAHPFLKHLFPLFQNTGYVVTRAVLGTRFEAAAESLHRLFPAYAEALTVPGVVDILYAVGFLGVRRGNDVVFAGGDDLPAQFHETEFHVHPCFRAALGATSAIDLRHFEIAAAIGRVVQGGNQGGFNDGAFVTTRSRDHRLIQELRRSCHSILAQTSRAVSLAQGAQDEITQQINRVLDEVNALRPGAGSAYDLEDRVLTTAHYFDTLAAQLLASGLDDSTGAGDVVRRVQEEARRLRRQSDGSYGSSGSSAGP
ncbi:P-loop ATPase, Sll1717 family [Streptomyces sp. NPDC050538]|uniref:P-loop ATPase, Sll1717 family n=1 Tax=Streptomyces sp. NPDC050538 TaxID=3365627 RepID=UPI00379CC05C